MKTLSSLVYGNPPDLATVANDNLTRAAFDALWHVFTHVAENPNYDYQTVLVRFASDFAGESDATYRKFIETYDRIVMFDPETFACVALDVRALMDGVK